MARWEYFWILLHIFGLGFLAAYATTNFNGCLALWSGKSPKAGRPKKLIASSLSLSHCTLSLCLIVEHFKIIARVFGLVTWLASRSGCWFKRDHTDNRHLILKSFRVHSDLALTVELVARILRHTLPSDDGLELRHNCAICIPEAELRLWEPYSYRCRLSIIRQTSPSDAHKSAELNKVYHIMLIVEIWVSFFTITVF